MSPGLLPQITNVSTSPIVLFTEAAQERNIEVGVVLDHPRIAQSLVARFEALREKRVFRRMAT